jgi:hypothetical protein
MYARLAERAGIAAEAFRDIDAASRFRVFVSSWRIVYIEAKCALRSRQAR